jgi:hypothetical protein
MTVEELIIGVPTIYSVKCSSWFKDVAKRLHTVISNLVLMFAMDVLLPKE